MISTKSAILFAWMVIALVCNLPNLDAQKSNHKRIQIQVENEKTIQQITDLGIDLICGGHQHHHDETVHKFLTLELSNYEYNRLKRNGIKTQILIDDLSSFYANRNTKALPKAIAQLEQKKAQQANKQQRYIYQTLGCMPSNFPVPLNFNLGSMGGCTTYSELLADLDKMAILYPNLITLKTPVSDTILTEEGHPVYYVKISDNPNVDEAETEVLYTGLHHAREPLSMMNLQYYLWYLLENYASDPMVKSIVDNTELYFIPVVNPDGYLYNESTDPNGGGLWRKNRKDNGNNSFGVDLNRNYSRFWGFDNSGSSPSTNNNTYRGVSAFSEAETRMIRDFTYERSFVNVFNNHSYGNLLLHPWSYQPFSTVDEELFDEISEQMTWHNRYNYGDTFYSLNYLANGESSDWFYGEESTKNKALSWVPEIGASVDGGFWPDPTKIQAQCERQLRMSLLMAASASNYGILNDLTSYNLDSPNTSLFFSVQHLSLTSGSFTVQVSSSSPYVNNIASPALSTTTLSNTESENLRTAINIDPTTPAGTRIDFEISLNNGLSEIFNTTITKMYNAVTIIEDDCTSLDQWTTTTWGLTTNDGYSDNSSITDSPTSTSSTGSYSIQLTQALDLSLADQPILEFYTKWEVARVFDFVQLQVSTNQTTWSALCGNYTKAGVYSLDFSPYSSSQPIGEGLYDGLQREWVREQIDLSEYAGVNNLYLRFLIFNDPDNAHGDGFYIDNFALYRSPLGHCEDGFQNLDETGIDCGGVDCIPCPSCTDGAQNGDEIGIDCGGTFCLDCATEQCANFNFNSFPILSFDPGQDEGIYSIQDGGNTLLIENNAWKAIKIDYNITANTVIEFDFKSTLEGEIHELEFDVDLIVGGGSKRYKLYGYQDVPLNETYSYSGAGVYQHFTIPIGTDFTGFYPYLVFTVDSDISGDGNSYFRNVTIYEDLNNNTSCDGFTTDYVSISPKLLLRSIYDSSTGNMKNDLRTQGILPTNEPYTSLGYLHLGGGNESINSTLLQVNGTNAIIDWVIVELRDQNDPALVVATRAALLQVDGDIVDVDGVSNVIFKDVLPDNYYVAVRHRNHLGTMTASALPLGGSSSM